MSIKQVSIDTIGIMTNFELQLDMLEDNGFTYHNRKSSNSSGSFNSYYFKQGKFLTIKYFDRKCLIKVTFSVPKLIFTNNIFFYKDCDFSALETKFLSELRKDLNPHIVDLFPSFEEWDISRFDSVGHVIVNSEVDKAVYIKTLKKLSLKRYDALNDFDTSFFIKNKSVRIEVYDKAAEIKKNSPNFNITDEQNRILRVEVEWKNPKLNSCFQSNKKVKNLLNTATAYHIMKKSLDQLKLTNMYRTMTDTLYLVDNNFSPRRSSKLKKFIIYLNKNGIDASKTKYSSSYYTNFNDLTAVGINPLTLEGEVSSYITFDIITCPDLAESILPLVKENLVFFFIDISCSISKSLYIPTIINFDLLIAFYNDS